MMDTTLKDDINAYAAAVADDAYNSSPIIAQLRAEVALMRRALENHASGLEDNAVLSQHISYYGLGRGFSTPVHPQRSNSAQNYAFTGNAYPNRLPGFGFEQDTVSDSEEENPEPAPAAISAVFQNHAQRMVSNTLRYASSNPHNPSSNNSYSATP
jgi:hypothetical protein